MTDEADAYTRLARIELDEVVRSEEIQQGLADIEPDQLTPDDIVERARRDIHRRSSDYQQVPEIRNYVAARRRAFPNGVGRRLFLSPSPRIDRLLMSMGAAIIVFAFIGNDSGVNRPLAYASAGLFIISQGSRWFPVRPSLARAISSGLLGLAIILAHAALFSVNSIDDASAFSHDDTFAVGLAATLSLLIAVPLVRRNPTSAECPPGFRTAPLRIDSVSSLMIATTAIGCAAVVFLYGLSQKRVISAEQPDATTFTIGIGLLVLAAMHSLASIPFQSRPHALELFHKAESSARTAIRFDDVLPLIRNYINNAREDVSKTYKLAQAPGLSEAFDPLYEVSTGARERLDEVLRAMPGGAIGLAGPRGVGKSTLIAAACKPRRPKGKVAVAVMVSAPVRYSSREFLLGLYANICRAVLKLSDSDAIPVDPMARPDSRRVQGLSAAYGLFMVSTGAVLLGLQATLEEGLSVVIPFSAVIVLLGIFFIVQSIGRDQLGVPHHVSAMSLDELASQQLREIHYQHKVAGSWSGGGKAPVGLEAAIGGSRELARREMTLPEIVGAIRAFIALAAEDGSVVIGIDELDKMESEDAALGFLNDIKGVFGVSGCYFLVSISEDALSAFERRGLPFRDAFDSSLDEVVRVPPLTFPESVRLLNRRVIGVPVPFKQFLYCYSGGLARDLIRGARALVRFAGNDSSGRITIARAVVLILGEDVKGKMSAAVHSLRSVSNEPGASDLMQWCIDTSTGGISQDRLASRLAELRAVVGSNLFFEKNFAIRSVAEEMGSYVYFVLTLFDLFSDLTNWDPKRYDDLVMDLGEARALFSTSRVVAWNTLSRIRVNRGLEDLTFPTLADVVEVVPTASQ